MELLCVNSYIIAVLVVGASLSFFAYITHFTRSHKQKSHTVIEKLASKVLHRVKTRSSSEPPLVLGINGCCGAGKSTLATRLQSSIESMTNNDHPLNIVRISTDDLYKTKEDRNGESRLQPGSIDPSLKHILRLLKNRNVRQPRAGRAPAIQ